MNGFQHERLPQRLQIGTGNAADALTLELQERGGPRVLLIGTDRAASSVICGLSPAAHIREVKQHVPMESAIAARRTATDAGVELIVCIGGGSATGLAKAVALYLDLPIIAVPTTFSGSEATPIWGVTENRRKVTGIDSRVLPASVIYDTELLAGLPRNLAVASALNALAHGVDAMWAPRADPISGADAEAGIRWIGAALRAVEDWPSTDGIRGLIVGTYLSSTAFAGAGSGMHHKICHVLGGTYDLPHAPLHAVILPHVLEFNACADDASGAAVARALDTDNPVAALLAIYDHVRAPRSLAELGFREQDIDEAASLCLEAIPPSNPRSVDLLSVRNLLRNAWAGTGPSVRRTQ